MALWVNFIKHLGKSYQTFIPLKLFQKVAEKGKCPNLFHEATITMIPKSKTSQETELAINIDEKFLNSILIYKFNNI